MCNVGMLGTPVVVSTHFHVTDFIIVADGFYGFHFRYRCQLSALNE